MFRYLLPVAALAVTGCATPRVEKMSFAEAFAHRAQPERPAPEQVPVLVPDNLPRLKVVPASATESSDLLSELTSFAHASRKHRQRVSRGGRMPAEQQANWDRVLASIDQFLQRPAEQTLATDVMRARAAAEAELELDSKVYGDIPPELAERVLSDVTRLAVRMNEVRRLSVRPEQVKVVFDWPIDPVEVTSLFGKRLHPISGEWRSHFGVDLDAYQGQLVMASADGVVVSAGWRGPHGRQVELRHPNGVTTRYSHLSTIVVQPGNKVERGDPIGLAGRSGLATGSHLHFEFWRNGRPRDPLDELASQPASRVKAGKVPRS